jgi:IS5 family transposase
VSQGEGDAIRAVPCGAGHTLRPILAHRRVLLFVSIVLGRHAAQAVKEVWHAMAATLGVAVRVPPTARPG